MPIPNSATLYQKIGKGAEGGHEFARFIKLLLISEYKHSDFEFVSESDASGDYLNLDAYSIIDKKSQGFINGFQFKFYPTKLNSNQKSAIINSLKKGMEANPYMKEFILITPEDFMKEELKWFNGLKSKYEKRVAHQSEGLYSLYDFQISHWGHSKIIELTLKNDSIGIHYFPELFPVGIGKFKLAKAGIDTKISSWYLSENYADSFRQTNPTEGLVQTSDPIFDFQFINNSNKTFLLNAIEIHISNVTSTLCGFPAEKLLKSIGTLEHKVDFKKPVNVITLDDPLIFDPNKPLRFNIQLNDFTQDCPGNGVNLKFKFYFDDTYLVSNEFHLSF